MKRLILVCALLLPTFLYCGDILAQSIRGLHRVTLEARSSAGDRIALYGESHALLVGVSQYTNGWPNLDSIPRELDSVQGALEQKGFNVIRVRNPNSRQLQDAYRNFINTYGYTQGARLIFYFAGHGHSDDKGRGFLVPADAPVPEQRKEFLQKSLQMNQMMAWARQIDTNHALFLFDSCFSGSIFKSRNLPAAKDRFIKKATSQPVRQFITAGSAGEIVPAKSVFTPSFVDAISSNKGDLNNDGYITGSELGLYLTQTVPQFADQSPQYGKIRDYDLAQGDFVFFGNGTPVSLRAAERKPVSDTTRAQRRNTVVESPYLQNIQISDADRKLVWSRLNNLKWALENKNLDTVESVSNLSKEKKQLLQQLFKEYKAIDVELVQMSENGKAGAISGHLRFKQFTRNNGSIAYPVDNIRENRVVAKRTKNGWTPFQW